jgi:hypothetical protein
LGFALALLSGFYLAAQLVGLLPDSGAGFVGGHALALSGCNKSPFKYETLRPVMSDNWRMVKFKWLS